MAATTKALAALKSRVSMYKNRVAPFFKQTRSCHIPIQIPVPSLSQNVHTMKTMPLSTIGRSPELSQNRLLSDKISCATMSLSRCPQSISRSYSVLPQRLIYTTVSLHSNEPTQNHRKCWNCGKETDALAELFFCHCGVVQLPAEGMTFYTLFDIEEGFDIDLKMLSKVYKDLQKHLHPDMFSQKSETEQNLAEQQSSLLNKAYFTLLKPLPRAVYLLELHGHVIEEGTTDMNPEFLMEVLDLNERIAESTSDDISIIERDIKSKIDENTELLASAFASKEYADAKEITMRLKYYVNVESKIKTFYRDRM